MISPTSRKTFTSENNMINIKTMSVPALSANANAGVAERVRDLELPFSVASFSAGVQGILCVCSLYLWLVPVALLLYSYNPMPSLSTDPQFAEMNNEIRRIWDWGWVRGRDPPLVDTFMQIILQRDMPLYLLHWACFFLVSGAWVQATKTILRFAVAWAWRWTSSGSLASPSECELDKVSAVQVVAAGGGLKNHDTKMELNVQTE